MDVEPVFSGRSADSIFGRQHTRSRINKLYLLAYLHTMALSFFISLFVTYTDIANRQTTNIFFGFLGIHSSDAREKKREKKKKKKKEKKEKKKRLGSPRVHARVVARDGSQPGCGVPKARNLERGVPKSLKLEHVTSRHIHPHHPRSEGDSHGRGASRAVRGPDVDARDRGRFVESEPPASVEASALLAAAALLAGRPARPEIEGFAIRLRRRVTTIAAMTITIAEIASVKVGAVVVGVVGPLILWDAPGRELGQHSVKRGLGEEIPN